MKDILLRHGDSFIECELEELKMTYTFSDDPKAHTVVILKDHNSYDDLKIKMNRICKSYGYDAACNFLETVDCHRDYFEEGNSKLYFDLRTREEIEDYLDEANDKVWLMRNCFISKRIPKHEAGIPAINRIFSTYDDIPKEGYTNWGCGYWNGIMGALRWVLGLDKDFLDS